MNFQLFVDESGAGWLPQQRFIVGGLLVRSYANRAFREDLERQLRRATPGLVWPPHAYRLRFGATLVESVLRGAEGCSPVAVDVASLLDACEDPAVVEWRESAIARGGESSREHLLRADSWIRRHHSHAWRRLTTEIGEIRQSLADQLATLDATVVACLDARGSTDEPPIERYLRTYTGLLERVSQLRRPSDGLMIQTLMFDRGLDRAALDGAAHGLRPELDLVVHHREPRSFGAQTHPALVLADFVANRLHFHLRRGSWDQVRTRLEQTLRLPVEVPSPRAGENKVPTIAVEGPLRTWIRAAFNGPPGHPPPPPASVGEWAYDQAACWVRALEGAQ